MSNYNTKHEVWVDKSNKNKNVVRMANGGDGCYVQIFNNRQELDKFIEQLLENAKEAWG